jgi:dihydrodipicolinate reductase
MKVILYGFGLMGQKIYHQLKKENHQIQAVVSKFFNETIEEEMCESLKDFNNNEADVIIDFSHPDNLDDIIQYVSDKEIKLVLATTGYSKEQLEKIKLLSENHAIFQSYNTSFGISMVMKILKASVEEFYQNNFDIEILEKHHHHKIDAPSGTAKLLYQLMADELGHIVEPIYDRSSLNEKREHHQIGLQAIRGGTIFGDHSIIFAGNDEIVEINHTALSKEVFVTGAIHAAKILLQKENGYYTLKNIY